MKRRMTIVVAAVAVALAAVSCDSKRCVCYSATNSGIVEEDVYVDVDTPCSSLSNSNRGCIEEYEVGTIDPGDIAYTPAPRR